MRNPFTKLIANKKAANISAQNTHSYFQNVFADSKVAANQSIGAIPANQPVEPVLSRTAGRISQHYRLDPNEIAGRKYYHNQGINNEMAAKKEYLKFVKNNAENPNLINEHIDADDVNKYLGKIQGDIEDLRSRKYGAADIATDYLVGSGKFRRNMMRTGTTIGLYGTASLGVRGIAGGTPTRNADGKKDIAGIPFI